MENGGYLLGPAAADMARRPTSPASAAPVIASVLGGWLLGPVLRRTSVRRGVSDAEAYGSLPGDEVIPHPMVEWTRGVTVRTTPERVWPWLAQMGTAAVAGIPRSWWTSLPIGGCSALSVGSPKALTDCCRSTSRSTWGSDLRRARLCVVLPCSARRSTACSGLPLDSTPAARQPHRHH